jgi:hypothetical protein
MDDSGIAFCGAINCTGYYVTWNPATNSSTRFFRSSAFTTTAQCRLPVEVAFIAEVDEKVAN